MNLERRTVQGSLQSLEHLVIERSLLRVSAGSIALERQSRLGGEHMDSSPRHAGFARPRTPTSPRWRHGEAVVGQVVAQVRRRGRPAEQSREDGDGRGTTRRVGDHGQHSFRSEAIDGAWVATAAWQGRFISGFVPHLSHKLRQPTELLL